MARRPMVSNLYFKLQAERSAVRNLRFSIDEYEKAAEDYPLNPEIANTLGDLYVKAGDIRQAVSFFSKVAELYRVKGFIIKSIAVLKKISRLDPADTDAPARMGDLLSRQGLLAEARQCYATAGDLKFRRGELKGAIEVYKKLIALGSDGAPTFSRMGEIYSECNMPEEAHHWFVEAKTSYLQKGMTDQARDVAARARKIELGNNHYAGSREKRRAERFALRLPALIAAEDNQWREHTQTVDVSRSGIRFSLVHPVDWGSILRVQLPLPAELRVRAEDLRPYSAQALVCRCEEAAGARMVAAEFGMASELMSE